jgi:hypothetical protein
MYAKFGVVNHTLTILFKPLCSSNPPKIANLSTSMDSLLDRRFETAILLMLRYLLHTEAHFRAFYPVQSLFQSSKRLFKSASAIAEAAQK